jgi:hypothetical protein
MKAKDLPVMLSYKSPFIHLFFNGIEASIVLFNYSKLWGGFKSDLAID